MNASTETRVGTTSLAVGGAQRPLRVLEAVAGDGADDARARRHEPGRRGSASSPATQAAEAGSTKTPSCGREVAVRVEDLLVGHGVDAAAGLVAGGDGLLPRGGVADADGRGDRLGVVDGVAEDDRRGAGRLEAQHPRQVRGRAGGRSCLGVLAVALQ